MLSQFWKNMSKSGQISFVAGLTLIIALTVVLGFSFLRTEYQILFSNLTPQDANAMVTELERIKVPYKLANEGSTILVDKDAVHKTRIKLMGKEFPLHGTVGFELFNNSDFGMTEFAQKINYQRAMQGEIARTILSLNEIDSARVHLAFPDEGLFKKNQNRAKAAISIVLKKGAQLLPEQVSGIQRLVSAAVPAIQTQDVTVVDQRGVALTKLAQDDTHGDVSSTRLELKKETEQYLTKKADSILQKIFGDGFALASVDVTLNMDRIKVTTDDVIGIPAKSGQAQTGVVVREKESSHDSNAPLDAKMLEMSGGRSAGSLNHETEYQVGHRVEQLVSVPGAITKLQVVAVVNKEMDAQQQEQIRQLIFTAVGASNERGDSVIVQTQALKATSPVDEVAPFPPEQRTEFPVSSRDSDTKLVIWVVALLIVTLVAGLMIGKLLFSKKMQSRPLTEEERAAALNQIQSWLQNAPASAQAKGRE